MGGKLKAAALLSVMYGLGAVSGIAWHTHRIEQRGLHRMYVAKRVHRLKHELRLTPAQEHAVKQLIQKAQEHAREIHEEVSQDFAQIHEEAVQAIQAVLTPKKQQRFEKLHQKSHAKTS
ncbi:MAG: hypothetical protein HYZ73_00600 [Elusimicrobia bacterium]|nr:hypothetical protein [Elusimicrobiota bacterium]